VQRALDKWWRVGLNMFGPPHTRRTPLYLKLGLKYRTNEDRRQAFRAATEPVIEKLGLTVPRLWRSSFPFI
jgi:1,2-phenylacetyl-CoA epoxidase catalytic subunit